MDQVDPGLHDGFRGSGSGVQEENKEETSVDADVCAADAANTVLPGAVRGAYGRVLGWEDLQEPVRWLVLAACFRWWQKREGRSGVTSGEDAYIALFNAL